MTAITDLLLIHPGAAHGIREKHPIYGDLARDLTALEPPPWARMIAGYIRNRGFSVKIFDAEAAAADGLDQERIARAVTIGRNARLIAIVVYGHQPSASTQQMVGAGQLARAIKALAPDRTVVMLGNHPSALPERTLREEAVDYVIDGEGPRTLEALLLHGDPSKIEDALAIPGLVWRWRPARGEKIVHNAPAPLIENMDDDLHGDAWDLLPMQRYRAHNWHALTGPRQPYASIYTTLGCPFKCSFCMINSVFHANRYRRHSPNFVANQIHKLYRDYDVRSIKIADEMFILNEEHYEGICERLYQMPYAKELNIWAYARVDTVKPHTLKLLRNAGIRWLALGIESGSEHVRDGADKKLRTKDIVGVVRAIQNAGICVIGNYIFGLPDEDLGSMQATLDLAKECQTEWANFYCAMAYPGSRLYDEALATGSTLPETWRGYSQHNDDCRPLDSLHVDARTILRFRDAAFRDYFADAAFRRHIAFKFPERALSDIDKMLEYKLERKLLAEPAPSL